MFDEFMGGRGMNGKAYLDDVDTIHWECTVCSGPICLNADPMDESIPYEDPEQVNCEACLLMEELSKYVIVRCRKCNRPQGVIR